MPILYVIIFIPQKSVKNQKRAAARLLFLLAMGCEEKTGLRKDRFEIREKSANIEKNRRQTIRRQTGSLWGFLSD